MNRHVIVACGLCLLLPVFGCQDKTKPAQPARAEPKAAEEKTTPDEVPPAWAGGGLEVVKISRADEKQKRKAPPELDQFVIAFKWPGVTDDVGVTGLELKKDGKVVATPAPDKREIEVMVVGRASGKWELIATDAAGNRSRALVPGVESMSKLEKAERAKLLGRGIIGALLKQKRGKNSSLFGRGSRLGTEVALKGLIGNQIGDAHGMGGLGLRGVGRRGKGSGGGGLGIGIGVMGKGGGGGYGHRARRRGPVVRMSGGGTAELRRYLRRKLNRFRYCYERQLRKAPTLAGKLAVDLAVDTAGRVTVTATRGMADAGLTSCFERAALGRLSAAPGKTQAATYVFSLAPGASP